MSRGGICRQTRRAVGRWGGRGGGGGTGCGGSTGMAPPPAVTDTTVANVVIMAAGPAFTKTPMRIELIGNWK